MTIEDDDQAIDDRHVDDDQAGEAAAGADQRTTADDSAGDHEIVLGWWHRPLNLIALLVTTALMAGMIGWLINDTVSEADGSAVDVGFLWDMRVHHEQAVQMGFIYLDSPGADPALRTVASEIVMGQSIEIGRMVQILRGFGEEEARDLDDPTMGWMGMVAEPNAQPGLATEAQIDALQQAEGAEADELFVELMTTHHRGGIDMASYAAEHGDDDQVVQMAEAMARAQQSEIAEMERLIQGE